MALIRNTKIFSDQVLDLWRSANKAKSITYDNGKASLLVEYLNTVVEKANILLIAIGSKPKTIEKVKKVKVKKVKVPVIKLAVKKKVGQPTAKKINLQNFR